MMKVHQNRVTTTTTEDTTRTEMMLRNNNFVDKEVIDLTNDDDVEEVISL